MLAVLLIAALSASANPTQNPKASGPAPSTVKRKAPALPAAASKTPSPPFAAVAPAAVVELPPEPPPHAVAFDLELGGGAFSRHLSFQQDLFGAFSNYSLVAAPLASVQAALYPLAPFVRGWFLDVGIEGGLWESVGATSVDASQLSYATQMSRFFAGLKARVPLGDSEVSASCDLGRQLFDLGALPGQTQPIPNLDTTFLQAGLQGRVGLTSWLAVLGEAAYLAVLQTSLTQTFTRATGAGVDAQLGLAFALWKGVELRLEGGYQRYFFDMHAVPGDTHVAGGAVDEYASGSLSIAARVR